MRVLLISFLIFFSTASLAETLKIVTGEYSPYTGEKLAGGGVTSQVVKAAFAETGRSLTIEFIPWNRAMNYLKSGSVSGSFPWTKNPEREKDVLYSDIIHYYRLLTFVKKNSELEKKYNPAGKRICLPSGWDSSFIKEHVEAHKMIFDRPINMESCFQMLALGRVDLIITNENVGIDIVNKLYKKDAPFSGLETAFKHENTNLYFIVPKTIPNAALIIADFNRGLAMLKKNGKFDKITRNLNRKLSTRSNCEICSRLGSL